MDQDQQEKQKHVCKFCNKSFANGKILGGHMRCHAAKNPLKQKAKLAADDACFEGCEKIGYGLRVNPKKSSRVSPSIEQEAAPPPKEVACGVCGKEFETMRALFGHMRHHSKRGRETVYCCGDCDREFESFRALSCHMKSHAERGPAEERLFSESSGLVKKKRSRRSRLKFGPSTSSALSVTESSSTVGPDADREAEEIAECLLMLAQGVSVQDPLFPAENTDAGPEAMSLNRDRTACENGGGSTRKKAKIGSEGGFLDGKKPSKNNEEKESLNLSLSLSTEASDPALSGDLESTRMTVFNPEDVECSNRRSEYRCRICHKLFYSHQALGGHQTIHRSAKSDSVADDLAEFEGVESCKEHKCHICLKVFASGQALGGHKRAHAVRDEAEAEAEQTPLLSHQEASDSMDSDDAELRSPSPWWIRTTQKHELLVSFL